MYKAGSLIADPLGREEYVTVTGFDSVKNTVHYKTKDGTQGVKAFRDSIGVEGELVKKQQSTPKITKAPKDSPVPISYIGTNLPPIEDKGFGDLTVKKEPQQQKPPAEVKDPVAEAVANDTTRWTSYQKALAGAEFFVDIMNANAAYASTTGQARLNILQARNDASDAIYRGRLAQMDRQSEGRLAGQDATLAMAAQGQDVGGAGVEKVSGSMEAMGYENGAREMINAYREALGYELEEVNYDYQIEQARQQRNNQMVGATLNFATSMAVL